VSFKKKNREQMMYNNDVFIADKNDLFRALIENDGSLDDVRIFIETEFLNYILEDDRYDSFDDYIDEFDVDILSHNLLFEYAEKIKREDDGLQKVYISPLSLVKLFGIDRDLINDGIVDYWMSEFERTNSELVLTEDTKAGIKHLLETRGDYETDEYLDDPSEDLINVLKLMVR
jgi:hypothetical protein